MNRKLRTIGLFAPRVVSGELIENQQSRSIYGKLREFGFRQTRWQYVYEGQIAGIVLPYMDGRNEVHVRFYHDRIVAELEVGRAYISHFLTPLLNANGYLTEILKDKITNEECQFLHRSLQEKLLRDDEKRMPAWNYQKDPSPSLLKLSLTGDGPLRSIARLCISCFGWSHVTLCLTAAVGILSVGQNETVGLLIVISGVLSALFIPTVGRP